MQEIAISKEDLEPILAFENEGGNVVDIQYLTDLSNSTAEPEPEFKAAA